MNSITRAAAALLLSATLAPSLSAQPAPQGDVAALSTERARVSYMVGMDVGASLRSAGPGLDMAAFERAVRNALSGGEPPVDDATAHAALTALAARGQAGGGLPPGTPAPELDWNVLSVVIGHSVGASLAPISGEFELPILLQAARTVAQGGEPLLSQADYTQVREAFAQRMQVEAEAQARALGEKNRAEGEAFLAGNKAKKGVFTTGSGLQYMVLRPGAGERPKPSDTVRVQYAGTLLDGTTFDSSYDRGEPAQFRLDQVIPGWTEGVALMPVGAKYRLWIPAELAYGARGTPGGPIGPNATLVFDVELLAIP